MSAKKQRLTVTVDPDLIEAAQLAVDTGAADSVSGWVSTALRDKVQRDRKLAHLGSAIADYETEFGAITPEEIAVQQRADQQGARVIRGRRKSPKPWMKPLDAQPGNCSAPQGSPT